jgi:hypothetical protein
MLAVSLATLTASLQRCGRRNEALATATEAVGIRRQLALEQPASFRVPLASSLRDVSILLSDLGQRRQALVSIEEAIQIILPRLEEPDVLPDAERYRNSYVSCCKAAGRIPDRRIMARFEASGPSVRQPKIDSRPRWRRRRGTTRR